MRIKLISLDEFNEIKSIFDNYPKLTLNNKGYEGLDKSTFTPEEKNSFDRVNDILKSSIEGFVRFQNFRTTRHGDIELRLQYAYDHKFTGVGYLLLDELLNGFKPEEEKP